jgi:hypothetical protein
VPWPGPTSSKVAGLRRATSCEIQALPSIKLLGI